MRWGPHRPRGPAGGVRPTRLPGSRDPPYGAGEFVTGRRPSFVCVTVPSAPERPARARGQRQGHIYSAPGHVRSVTGHRRDASAKESGRNPPVTGTGEISLTAGNRTPGTGGTPGHREPPPPLAPGTTRSPGTRLEPWPPERAESAGRWLSPAPGDRARSSASHLWPGVNWLVRVTPGHASGG